MKVLTQNEIKCSAQNSKKMYFHYLDMQKNNNSKFIKRFAEEYKNDFYKMILRIKDKNWVIKNGMLK